MKNAKREELGATGVAVISAACLLLGHLLLREYMPNIAYGAIGFILLVTVLSYVLFLRREVFAFVLVIYICSHFSFADNQGGLWNLLAFGMLVPYLVIMGRRERPHRPDMVTLVLIFVLLTSNVLGWAFMNPLPLMPKVLGAITFLSYILVFKLVSDLEITRKRVRTFIVLTALMLAYSIIIALNQRYAFINYNTPLLGAYQEEIGRITYGSTNAQGPFRNSELFGEYAVLLLALLIPLLSSSETQRTLNTSVKTILVMILACGAIILLTSTRAAAILAVAVVIINYLVFTLRPLRVLDAARRQVLLILIAAAAIPVVGVYVGVESLSADFSDIADTEFTVESVASGKAINRGPLVEFALNRLEKDSWIIGYGYGIPRSNRWAWFGMDPAKGALTPQGLHMLYLSLPMVYGWLGAVAFVLLVLITWFRATREALKWRLWRNYLVVLAFGFSVFWFVFIVDQYKISILRNLNYHMLFWIWLGMTNAVVKTLRRNGMDFLRKQSV